MEEVLDRRLNYIKLNRYFISDLKEFAQSKGGDCLSKIYTNSSKRYKWVCSEGHIWLATFNSVYHHDTWCPICSQCGGGLNGGIYRSRIKPIIKKLGWKMISEYQSDHDKIKISCQYGHEFKTQPSKLSTESKCPICEEIKTKNLILYNVLERINLKGGKLLSDKKDIVKIRNTTLTCSCKKGHVFQVSVNNLLNVNAWCNECAKEKRALKKFKTKKITVKLNNIVTKSGWKMISEYEGAYNKIKVRCQHGHEFEIQPSKLSMDSKCPICEETKKKELILNNVLEKINLKGGKLLSDKKDIVKIRNTVITCSCKENHVFQISLNNLLNRDSWCGECAKTSRITKLKKYQEQKKGILSLVSV